MSNPFNCPDSVYSYMQKSPDDSMLGKIRALGPERVKWLGNPSKDAPYSRWFTAWELDGERALPEHIFGAT